MTLKRLLSCLALALAGLPPAFAAPAAAADASFGGGARAVQRQGSAVVGVYVLNERAVAQVDALPRGAVSHLLYAFLHLCGPGQLASQREACQGQRDFAVLPDARHAAFDAAFQRLKRRDPTVQVLASVGG